MMGEEMAYVLLRLSGRRTVCCVSRGHGWAPGVGTGQGGTGRKAREAGDRRRSRSRSEP